MFGASFDTPEDNNAFAEKFEFPFRLLSDVDRTVGALYEVQRSADDPFASYPMRLSYLIDPDGVIAKAYEVTDPAGHATEVLADLEALKR